MTSRWSRSWIGGCQSTGHVFALRLRHGTSVLSEITWHRLFTIRPVLWNDAGTRSSITPVTWPCWSTARLVHRDACDPGVRLVCALTIPLWVDVVAGRVRLERREALPPPGQGAVSDLCAGLDRLRRLTVTQRPSLNDGEPSMPSRNGEGSRLTPKLCYTIMSE